MGYIDLDYRPGEDIVCLYRVDARGVKKAAEDIAAESSVGTWTEIKDVPESLAARVFSIQGNLVKIAYPKRLFERENICQILSCVAGNIFGMKSINALRLEDLFFPSCILDEYMGPRFGVEGIRKFMKVPKRPLVGTIIKPKVGLPTRKHARVAYEAFLGGCDIVKDDENLSNQSFNPFKKRVEETLDVAHKAEDKTGERKAYIPNITSDFDEMEGRAEFVRDNGGRYMMVDVVIAGFSALQSLRKRNLPLAIHAHRAMHAALTRNQTHGISMLALAKLYRMMGADQLHIGTTVGKMEGRREEVLSIHRAMNEKLKGKRTVFSVLSGGLHPGHVPRLFDLFGGDVIMQFGGGIHGHPGGTESGAKACRQALDATMKNIPLPKSTRFNRELSEALSRWED